MKIELLELLQLGSKNNYEFHFKMTEENENLLSVDLENKLIDVSIGNPDDVNLSKEINQLIEKIKAIV